MSDITLGGVALPQDMQWADEFTWLPVAQQQDVSCGGALIIEESVQLAGRPITLQNDLSSNPGFGLITRVTVVALRALASAPLSAPITLDLGDGRTFNVRFRYSDGPAVSATAVHHIVPPADDDLYSLTVRLIEVAS